MTHRQYLADGLKHAWWVLTRYQAKDPVSEVELANAITNIVNAMAFLSREQTAINEFFERSE